MAMLITAKFVAVFAIGALGTSIPESTAASISFKNLTRKLSGQSQKFVGLLKAHAKLSQADTSQRRLATPAQCTWLSDCEVSDDFTATLVPSSGPIADMWAAEVECKTHTVEADCIKVSSCMWSSSTCMASASDKLMEKVIQDIIMTDAVLDGCGLLGTLLKARGPCEKLSASTCTGNANCALSPDYEYSGNTCSMVETCNFNGNLATEVMCPGISSVNMTAKMETCINGGVNASDGAALTACYMADCPEDFREYLQKMSASQKTCEALGMADCKANSNCKEEESVCKLGDGASTMLMMPDGCKLQTIVTRPCAGQSNEQDCTGVSGGMCRWETTDRCDGTSVMKSSSCSDSMEGALKDAVSSSGSGDALALLNLAEAEKGCMGKADKAKCEAAESKMSSKEDAGYQGLASGAELSDGASVLAAWSLMMLYTVA